MALIEIPDGSWGDTGEGGLYFMMVVLRPTLPNGVPDSSKWPMHVCEETPITLSYPDAMVSPWRPVWAPYSYEDSGSKERFELADVLKKTGNERYMNWVMGARSHKEESAELLAAVQLGSVGWVPNDPENGVFEARYEHLTAEGRAIYDAFRAAYGIEPLILTLLDT